MGRGEGAGRTIGGRRDPMTPRARLAEAEERCKEKEKP
jgi:hypothetical protein